MYFEQRTLNLVDVDDFLIFTEWASFLRAVTRKFLMSRIWRGCQGERRQEPKGAANTKQTDRQADQTKGGKGIQRPQRQGRNA